MSTISRETFDRMLKAGLDHDQIGNLVVKHGSGNAVAIEGAMFTLANRWPRTVGSTVAEVRAYLGNQPTTKRTRKVWENMWNRFARMRESFGYVAEQLKIA